MTKLPACLESLLLFSSALWAYPAEGGSAVSPPAPSFEQVVQQMEQADQWRTAALQNYTVMRRYRVENKRFHKQAEIVVRVSFLYSRTQNLDVVAPFGGASGMPSLLGLADTGGAHYHEIETTLHYRWTERSELNLSYVHSRGRGDLNTLSGVFVPFQRPVIRPNLTGNFTSDVPNRMVSWGVFPLPWKLTLSPVVDVRTGFPYSVIDTLQNYVGAPNSQRFLTFFSLDARLYHEFKVSSLPPMGRFKNHRIRFGVYSLNLTNHGNYLDVYNNVASPYFGHFAGLEHRVDGLVIDLVE